MSTYPQAGPSGTPTPPVGPNAAANDGATTPAAPSANTGQIRSGWLSTMARDWLTLRKPARQGEAVLLGLANVALVLCLWWFLTRGEEEERILGSLVLPSPVETFAQFKSLWFDFALTRNTLATLRRVSLGFLVSIGVGVPLGVLAGCYPRFNAFLAPLVMFFRNIPVAALLPLLLFFFDGEMYKIMFIFIASGAFVLADTARAIADVENRYIDTAYTLGASRRQTILKVLVPLAMPSIFNSLRLLFGLAFGYIMLAEAIKYADESYGGLGFQIQTFQRRGYREHIYLIILIIPLVALAVDRLLFFVQRQLFPYQYGGSGVLHDVVRGAMHVWEGLWRMIVRPRVRPEIAAMLEASRGRRPQT